MSKTMNWAAERGEKWRTHLTGTEATLKPVDAPFIEALNLDAPYRIADIACGGGGTTLDIVRRAPEGSVVNGFDISPVLVDIAANRRPAAGSVTFTRADMQTAQPPGEPYDRVASRFGVMFFNDPPAAFANILTWLAPGGRFAFAVWNKPDENPWLGRVREIVAQVVDIPKPEPDEPGPFRYQNVDVLLGLLDRAGYSDLTVDDWHGRVAIGGGMPPAQAARFALASFSSFDELLAQKGNGALDEAQRLLEARFEQLKEEGEVRLGASVHIVTGRAALRSR